MAARQYTQFARAAKATMLVAMLLILAGVRTHGEEGRIPIFEVTTLNAGANGDFSGRYVVTRDITTSDPDAIRFEGSGIQNVELDLNGFTVTATGGTGQAVIYAQNLRRLVVRNGKIVGDSSRVGLLNASCPTMVVEDVTVEGVERGIFQDGAENFAVRRCIIDGLLPIEDAGQSGDGITIVGASAPNITFGTVEDNLIKNMSSSGILVQNNVESATVRNNRVLNAPNFWGILAIGKEVVVEDNQVDGARWGVEVRTQGCRVVDNVVGGSISGGIIISPLTPNNPSDCLVSGNVSSANVVGLLVQTSSGNIIEGNVLNNNTVRGLWLAGANNNIYRGNSFVGNGTECIQDTGTNNVDGGDNFYVGTTNCPPP